MTTQVESQPLNQTPAQPVPAGRPRRELHVLGNKGGVFSGFVKWFERSMSRLSTKNNFWHRVCSLIWLPYAFRSGIRMTRATDTFTCILPFRRFNRNWYNAMAGAALLGNSEVAGGMYIFKKAGKDYTVVCKELNYKFLRPCFGPAVYRVRPNPELDALIAAGQEFNITLELEVFQPPQKPSDREKRVGRCLSTFHVTPKAHHRSRAKVSTRAAAASKRTRPEGDDSEQAA